MAEAIPTNDIKFVAAILYRVYSRISHQWRGIKPLLRRRYACMAREINFTPTSNRFT